jgi:hypothetical protein
MMKVSSIVFWGIAELALLLFVLLLLVGLYAYLRGLQEKRAARKLIAHVKENIEPRTQEIGQILAERYGYQGERLEKTVRLVRRSELLLYQGLLHLYLKRNSQHLSKFYNYFEDAVQPYRTLEVVPVTKAPVMDMSELEALRAQNRELSEELRVTMDTLGRVLEEYAGTFSVEGEEDQPSPGGAEVAIAVHDETDEEMPPLSGMRQGDVGALEDWATELEVHAPEDDNLSQDSLEDLFADALSGMEVDKVDPKLLSK